MTCQTVRKELDRIGLLLMQDKTLPSVVGIITGESLSKSWWSHPRAQMIFDCLQSIEETAIAVNLIAGKVTFVHRRLWPAIVAVGSSRQRWQRGAKTIKEKRERLIAYAEEVHTPAGKHEMRLQPWSEFARNRGVVTISVEAARMEIEAATVLLGSTSKSLPWHRFDER
jgi:hypothetical protein